MDTTDRIYWIYLASALPTVILAWYLGFPRAYLTAFVGLSIGCIILNHYKDELIRERKVWKEYFIGLLGLILVPFIGYFHGTGLYLTLNDLYYLLIGLTVFQIGLVPLYCCFDFNNGGHPDNKSIIAWVIGTSIMMILSYILFIILDIRVVH